MSTYWDWNTFFFYNIILIVVALNFSYFSTNRVIIDYSKSREKKQITFLLISFSPALLSLALRAETIGGDLSNYLPIYQNFKYIDLNFETIINEVFNREILYVLTNLVLGYLSNWNNRMFILFYSLAPWVFIIKAINREVSQTKLVIPIMFAMGFFYIKSFSMLRQVLAMSIILYAFTYIKDKNFKKYLILTLIAVGFHYTALIALPIYLFANQNRLGQVRRIAMIFGLVTIFALGPNILEIITGFMGAKYSDLASNTVEIGIGNFLIKLPMTLIVALFYKKIIIKNPLMRSYLLIYFLTIIVIQFKYLNPLFDRLVYYPEMVLIFILPYIFQIIKEKTNNLFATTFFSVTLWMYFNYSVYFYTFTNPYFIMPYKFM